MNAQLQKEITAHVYRKFPDFTGLKPKIRKINTPGSNSENQTTRYLLTYQKITEVKSAKGNKSLLRWVRVVVSENGKIMKISTSR